MLRCVTRWYDRLDCVMLCCVVLGYALLSVVSRDVAFQCVALNYAMNYAMLCFAVLRRAMLSYVACCVMA